MKHFIIALFCLLTVATYAQNGGQADENGALKIQYVGIVNGNYTIKVTSKQDCNAGYKFSLNGVFSTAQINAYGVYLFNLGTQPPGAFTFKAKATTDCGCGDLGWVEIQLNILPLNFKSIKFVRNSTNTNKGMLVFETADVVNVNRFIIRATLYNKTKIEIGVVLPDALQPNTVYHYPIEDIKALAIRLRNQ
jgi:hypothetical protein